VKYIVEHGDQGNNDNCERDSVFHEHQKTALIQAYDHGHLPVLKYLISIRGGGGKNADPPQESDDHDLNILYRK